MYISQYHLNYNTVTAKKSEYCWKWCKASINLTNPTYVEGWEKFENTKGVIRSRTPKENRHYNRQEKRTKIIAISLFKILLQKTRDWATQIQLKSGIFVQCNLAFFSCISFSQILRIFKTQHVLLLDHSKDVLILSSWGALKI
jgi:hypothetical protein